MSVRFVAPVTLFVATIAVVGCSRKPPEPAKSTPPIVTVTKPVVLSVNDYEDFAGRTEPLKVVELRSRVNGYLRNIHFKDGQDIEQGKPLFEIDDRQYKADLDTARASLAMAEARLVFAKPNASRNVEGHRQGTISADDKDQAVSNLKGVEAAIDSAKAAIVNAETNYQFCRIYAPFDGRLDRRMVDEGNLVKANDTLLTTIVPLDEMYVTFDVDERTMLRVRRLILKGEVTSSRELELWVNIALADEDDFSLSAKVVFNSNQVDAGTGTLRVRATIRNPRIPKHPFYLLLPGQFVRVRVPIGPSRDATLVPEAAIGADQGQRFLYVLNAKNEVERRDVRVGQQYGKLRVIEDQGFKLTDRALNDLRQDKVPDAVLAKLDPLRDKELSREEFQKGITRVLKPEEVEPFQNLILRRAKYNVVSTSDRVVVEGLLRVRQGVEVNPKEFKSPETKGSDRPLDSLDAAPNPHVKQSPLTGSAAADARGSR